MTAEELAKVLAGNWKLRAMRHGRTRRQIFIDDDVLRFEAFGPTQLKLTAYYDIEVKPVLKWKLNFGAPIILTFNSAKEAFVGTEYGRKMIFQVDKKGSGYVLLYKANYVDPPHSEPDENGEGDPVIPPPP